MNSYLDFLTGAKQFGGQGLCFSLFLSLFFSFFFLFVCFFRVAPVTYGGSQVRG